MKVRRNVIPPAAPKPLARREKREKAGNGKGATAGENIAGAARRLDEARKTTIGKLMSVDGTRAGEIEGATPPGVAKIEAVASKFAQVAETSAELMGQMKDIGETAKKCGADVGNLTENRAEAALDHLQMLHDGSPIKVPGVPPGDGEIPGDDGGGGSGDESSPGGGSSRPHPHLKKAREFVSEREAAAQKTADKIREPIEEGRDRVRGARQEANRRLEATKQEVTDRVDAVRDEVNRRVDHRKDQVHERVDPVVENAIEKAAPVLEPIVETAAPIVGEIAERAEPALEKAGEILRPVADVVVDYVDNMWDVTVYNFIDPVFYAIGYPRRMIDETADSVRWGIGLAKEAGRVAVREATWFAGWSLDTIDATRDAVDLINDAGGEMAGEAGEALDTAKKLEGEVAHLLRAVSALSNTSPDTGTRRISV